MERREVKRFYKDVSLAETGAGWTIMLDSRPLKTQGVQPQVVPTKKLAELMAAEWSEQGEDIDPAAFRFRDMADYALDVIAKDPGDIAEKLIGYSETDTLCFRADPEEALFAKQQEIWEPLVKAVEAREGIRLHRVSGIVHRPQAAETRSTLEARLTQLDPFTLAALDQTTSLAASLCIGLSALEADADGVALWDAANLEEEWQADLWGRDEEAEERRARRKDDFLAAIIFAAAARATD